MSDIANIHVAEIIEAEMRERGWDRVEVARRMQPDADDREWGINLCALEFFLEVRCPNVIVGRMDVQFATAFGLEAKFINGLHEQWRSQQPPCRNACCSPEALQEQAEDDFLLDILLGESDGAA